MIENQGQREQKIVTIFDDIYNLSDCHIYYRAMDHAGFRTAHYASTAFRAVLAELKHMRGLQAANVMDFASGYGIGAALTRHDVSLDNVLARYRDTWFDNATSDEVIEADQTWLAQHRPQGLADRYAGIDIADKALEYGRKVGIFDAIFPENLQADMPSKALAEWLNTCDLIIECGSVAHMLPGALEHLLEGARDRRPWVITAPIRGNDTAEAIEIMKSYNLEVEMLQTPPFRHRRFADADEQARAIENAEARGHATEGYETKGYFHGQLFLARPKEEASVVSAWRRNPAA